MILTVDIGASKVKVASFSRTGFSLVPLRVERYLTLETDGVTPLLERYLAPASEPIDALVLGVAGPVSGDRVKMTNLPWVIDEAELSQDLRCQNVFLLNDLVAHGYGALTLGADDSVILQAGKTCPGNRAILAAGTGLGECVVFPCGATHHVQPSEGGHVEFAPRNDREQRLLGFLMKRYPDHVSLERVLSGKFGFRNLYDFLRHEEGDPPEPWAIGFAEARDLGPLMARAAAEGVPIAEKTLDWFVEIYGAAAGNLALQTSAKGGIFLSGGIARKNQSWFARGAFLRAFHAKGRLSPFLREIPIHIVTDSLSALKGMAKFAHDQLERSIRS
jgi:glucokinase